MDYRSVGITGVLLADGWHQVFPGTFTIDLDPSFTSDSGITVTPVGGPWLRFIDTTGAIIAAPLDRTQGIRIDPVRAAAGKAAAAATAGTPQASP